MKETLHPVARYLQNTLHGIAVAMMAFLLMGISILFGYAFGLIEGLSYDRSASLFAGCFLAAVYLSGYAVWQMDAL